MKLGRVAVAGKRINNNYVQQCFFQEEMLGWAVFVTFILSYRVKRKLPLKG